MFPFLTPKSMFILKNSLILLLVKHLLYSLKMLLLQIIISLLMLLLANPILIKNLLFYLLMIKFLVLLNIMVIDFGSIECVFKNQKSNDFYLENTKMKIILAFTTLFTLTCVALVCTTIIGIYYSKNKKNFPSRICIRNSYKSSNSNTLRFITLMLV